MKIFISTSSVFLLILIYSFSFKKKHNDSWGKIQKFDKQKDSFLLAPVSYEYGWLMRKDSSGKFYCIDPNYKVKKEDTVGWPRTSHILLDRTGDDPGKYFNEHLHAKLISGDTLRLTIGTGDDDWFTDFVINASGKKFKGRCEPGYVGAAKDYLEDSIHFKTVSQLLQLDKMNYSKGDSIKGFIDCSFDIWRNPKKEKSWKANVHLAGTFKAKIE